MSRVKIDPTQMPLVLKTKQERDVLPAGLPLAMFAAHEEQAKINNGQTLVGLAARGGLSPAEAVAILDDEDWTARPRDAATATAQLAALIDLWERLNPPEDDAAA